MGDIGKKLLLEEQIDLTSSTDELKRMIDKIKTHLNQLLVDQLQLKSAELQVSNSHNVESTNNPENTQETDFTIEHINNQRIDLNLMKNINTNDEVEEEEDDIIISD